MKIFLLYFFFFSSSEEPYSVEVAFENHADTLNVGCLVKFVIVGFVVNFQLYTARFIEFYVHFHLADNVVGAGSRLILRRAADSEIRRNVDPVVKKLRGNCYVKFARCIAVAYLIVNADVYFVRNV